MKSLCVSTLVCEPCVDLMKSVCVSTLVCEPCVDLIKSLSVCLYTGV